MAVAAEPSTAYPRSLLIGATFAAACRLVEFGLPWDAAWPLLCEWNGTHCQPPWCERDLRHKLADAFRRASPKADFAERGEGSGGGTSRFLCRRRVVTRRHPDRL